MFSSSSPLTLSIYTFTTPVFSMISRDEFSTFRSRVPFVYVLFVRRRWYPGNIRFLVFQDEHPKSSQMRSINVNWKKRKESTQQFLWVPWNVAYFARSGDKLRLGNFSPCSRDTKANYWKCLLTVILVPFRGWKSQKVKDVMAMCSQRPSHTPLLS